MRQCLPGVTAKGSAPGPGFPSPVGNAEETEGYYKSLMLICYDLKKAPSIGLAF